MVSEIISLVAVGGSLTGAALKAYQSYQSDPAATTFSFKKLFGGWIGALIPALAAINFSTIGNINSTEGFLAEFVILALAGAGAASVVAAAHK